MYRLKLESCKQITIINNITLLSGDNCRIGDNITLLSGDNCRIGDNTDSDVKSTANTSIHDWYALGYFAGYCIVLATHMYKIIKN